MSAIELVHSLEERGVELNAENGRLRYRAPKGVLTDEVREQLIQQRSEVLGVISERSSEDWPNECVRSERRFGVWHARLFPLIGLRVHTPCGPGRLFNVMFARWGARAGVILDATPREVTLMDARRIRPDKGGPN